MINPLGLDCHELFFLITMYSPITTLSASENRSMQYLPDEYSEIKSIW